MLLQESHQRTGKERRFGTAFVNAIKSLLFTPPLRRPLLDLSSNATRGRDIVVVGLERVWEAARYGHKNGNAFKGAQGRAPPIVLPCRGGACPSRAENTTISPQTDANMKHFAAG